MIRLLFLVFLLLGTQGCATTSGAAKLPFDSPPPKELQVSQKDLVNLAGADTVDARNETIRKLVAGMDVSFIEFRDSFHADKKHVSAFSDALTLLMTVAGTLTTSAGVKDNYLAGIALVTGGTKIYDERYLFSQTVMAITAQMEANRLLVLQRISVAMGKDLKGYPPIEAYKDVMEYHYAGSVPAALDGLNKSANKEAAEARALLTY